MQYYARWREGGRLSNPAFAAASRECWRARSSCIAASAFPQALKPGDKYAITDLELASKLSFFLWNSIPDEELLDLGIQNKLSQPATLDKQVQRMLADPRSKTLASNFVHQWLDMKRLDEIVPDNDVFPYASGRAGSALRISAPNLRCLPTAFSEKTATWWICCARTIRI